MMAKRNTSRQASLRHWYWLLRVCQSSYMGPMSIPTKVGIGPLNLATDVLGYPADLPPDAVAHHISSTSNFGVLNIAQVLPQWTRLTPIRHHFGLRTLMNTVEKLFNPANAANHISGFYHGSYLSRLALALPGTGRKWIIQGEEGSIDLRPGKKTRVYQAIGDQMQETMIDASDFGFHAMIPLEAPNDVNFHAEKLRLVLEGGNRSHI